MFGDLSTLSIFTVECLTEKEVHYENSDES